MRPYLASLAVLLLNATLVAQSPSAVPNSGSMAAPTTIHFHEANRELGLPEPQQIKLDRKYLIQQSAGGVALFDCDNDGRLDIAVVKEPTTVSGYLKDHGVPMVALYRQGTDGKFTDITAAAGLTHKGWGMGIGIADYDNDGLLDMYVTGFNGNVLYHNLGGCKFEDVTEQAGVQLKGYSTGIAWGDYDRDGKVDLFVSRYGLVDLDHLDPIKTNYKGLMVEAPWAMHGESDFLFHNLGNRKFEEVGKKAGVNDPEGRKGLSAMWTDLDGDGWPDLYVANDSEPNYLYHNKHDGTFEDIALLSGAAVGVDGKALGSMGIDIADYDRDGRLDVAITTFAYEPIELQHNNGADGFTDQTWVAHTGKETSRWVKWGIGFVDFANTGWLDLLISSGHVYTSIDQLPGEPNYREPLILFRNDRHGGFEEITKSTGLLEVPSENRRGSAFGDINNDGNIDVVIFNQDTAPSVFLNDSPKVNHRVLFQLEGTKSNRAAIGARISIETPEGKQLQEVHADRSHLSSSDLRVHFGLGKSSVIQKVEITWPSGAREVLENVKADMIYKVIEGAGIKSTIALPPIESK